MRLGFGLEHNLLLTKSGLQQVDSVFFDYVKCKAPDVHTLLTSFRQNPQLFSEQEYGDLILLASPIIEAFILKLFFLEVADFPKAVNVEDCLRFRDVFVLENPLKDRENSAAHLTFEALTTWLERCLGMPIDDFSEQRFMAFGLDCVDQSKTDAVYRLKQWCFLCQNSELYQSKFSHWYVLWKPKRIDDLMVKITSGKEENHFFSPSVSPNYRDDFSLIPSYWPEEKSMLHVDYCHYCHDREVDYCRSGFFKKKKDPSQGFKIGKTGLPLSGCPVDEKISQMHWLKHKKFHLGALVACMIDNPFCAVTGHRICNDCMQSCIFQKQEPVDTPQIESRVLMDVLSLPWGVEIYDLLLKWNPLRPDEYCPVATGDKSVLVMGLGPAGFSMIHHLWMRGCRVTGMDGAHLKDWPFGDVSKPVKHFSDICLDLSRRPRLGFGGVCEYGITSRWNKNLLNIVYLSLLRRSHVDLIGDCRFGGTIGVEDAWRWGFDHLVLALGAGLPSALNIPNGLAEGMVQASDFLMSLHEIGAQNNQGLVMLSMQLPCLVIGAGLTAVDAATEAQAYYLQMVQMVYLRFSKLLDMMGEQRLRACFSDKEYVKLSEWSAHGQACLDLKNEALRKNLTPCFRHLLQAWGGVNIVYRGSLEQAQAYKNNHYELQEALDTGIGFFAQTEVSAVTINASGTVSGLDCLQPHVCDWSYFKVFRVEKMGNQYTCFMESVFADLKAGLVVSISTRDDFSDDLGRWLIVEVRNNAIVIRSWHCSTLPLQEHLNQHMDFFAGLPKRPLNLAAKQVLVATGSMPNTAYEYEHKGHFKRKDGFYEMYDVCADGLTLKDASSHPHSGFFLSYANGNRRVSVVGDLHPQFHGSVVKALASSQHAVVDLMQHLSSLPKRNGAQKNDDVGRLHSDMRISVLESRPLMEGWHLLKLHAPWICLQSKAGHMFRLQAPYEGKCSNFGYESVSLQPYEIDHIGHTLTFVFQKNSVASKRLSLVSMGQSISCMGPTGVNLSSRHLSHRVLLLSDDQRLPSALLYRKHFQMSSEGVDFYVAQSEQAKRLLDCLNPDGCFEWLEESHEKNLILRLSQYGSIFLHGQFNFVRKYHALFSEHFRQYTGNIPKMVGFVGGDMQCMLKGICAQCLQWQVDPQTKERTKAVYACSWQDQPLEIVDLSHADSRNNRCLALSHLNGQWEKTFQDLSQSGL
ncbi:MAG: FAD-dependent oxidoreductase [Pseudomonadota bacterium]|nr:FAD-dependent oxidoreductase [Pseudomonadota bacterium]